MPGNPSSSRRSSRRLQARLILLAGDLLAVTITISVLGAVRNSYWASDEVNVLLAGLLPLYAMLALNNRAFALEALQRWQTGVRRALTSLGLAALIVLGIAFLLKVSADYSRLVLAGGLAAAAVTIIFTRYLGSRLIRSLFPHGILDVVLLVDGVAPSFNGPARVVHADTFRLRPLLDSPQMLDRIGKALHDADRVVLSCAPERREAWAAVLKGLGNEVQVLMPELDTLGMLGITRFDDQLAAVIAWMPLRMSERILKRAFDVVLVLFCLPILAVITIIVGILITMEDGGPIFFRQSRIGRGNRIFAMIKFRSMRQDLADADGAVSTARDDKRITRIGRWLRMTSIDELPQLFNVLVGDMSIVGPRPHALSSTAEDALFWDVDHRYWLRHAVKPGLTGLAQVRGYRGATVKTSDLTNRVQADLEYMVGWSLWRDVRIVVGTIKVMLHPNAF